MRILQTGVTLHNPDLATPGFTLFSPLWRRETYLIDMAGNVVHQWELPGMPGGYARLLPNGNLFYAAQSEGGPDFPGGAQGGLMREVDWDGNVINEIVEPFQHHDARRLENGNTVYAGWEDMPEDRAAKVAGGRPGTSPKDISYNDYVREVDADGNTVWQWSAHSMDIEKYPINPMLAPRVFAWLNATFPLPNGDVMVSLRYINTVAIIDRESKEIKWEKTDFSWGGQHDCQMLDNGNIILFANGSNTFEGHQHSRVIEIDPKYIRAWSRRGAAFAKKGEFKSSLNDYSEVIRLSPNNPNAYSQRSRIRESLKDIPGAIRDLEKSLEVASPKWSGRKSIEKRLGKLRDQH